MKRAFLFYIALFLFIFSVSTNVNNFDFDLWARLIAGMGVIDGGHVLTQDFLSYTPVHTWWDHEWGSGVIFYFFLKYLGPYSLIILQAILLCALFFTTSRIIKIRSDETPYNIVFYIFAFMSIIANLNNPVRCHLFSFLFFTIFIYIFEKARRGNNKFLYLVPIIVLFWNNIHGGIVSGLGLCLMYAVGEFLNGKPFKKYLITLAACLPILFINPWGYDYVKFLLMATTMKRPLITEWANIFSQYNLLKFILFKIMLVIMLFVEGIFITKSVKEYGKEFYKHLDKTKYIIILTTTYLAVSHIKMMPFFTIATLCFIYEDFYKLIMPMKFPAWKDGLIYTLIGLLALVNFAMKDISLPGGFDVYPVKEIEFIKINKLKGKILTNFHYGSYTSYKLYPHNLIFMDGRYEEVYYENALPTLQFLYFHGEDPQAVLRENTPDVIMIEKHYPIFKQLSEGGHWTLVYEGKLFGVFVPSDKVRMNYKQPSDDEVYYKNRLFDTEIKF